MRIRHFVLFLTSLVAALINFLPSSLSPHHAKACALEIIRRGSEYLKKWEAKVDANTDDLIELVSSLILRVNPTHLRSTVWAVTYYDVRGGSGECVYALAVLSSAVEYLKNNSGEGRAGGSYDECLKGIRMIRTGNFKEGISVMKKVKDPNLLSPGGRGGVVLAAVDTGRVEVIEQLYESCQLDLNIRVEYFIGLGRTGLFVAVEKCDYDMVAMLLKLGADRDLEDNAGDSCLMVAERARLRGRVSSPQAQPGLLWDHMVALLRTRPEEKNLIEECREGSVLVRHLIAQGCDVNKKDRSLTPLIEAVRFGRWETMQMLLASKAIDVNCTNNEGETALHLVASMRVGLVLKVKMTLKLLEAGASRNTKNASGETPGACAERNGCYEVKAIIGVREESICELAKNKNAEGVFGLLMQVRACEP